MRSFLVILLLLLAIPLAGAYFNYDVETKNDYTVEWFDESTLSKGEYIVSVQNLNPNIERTFDMGLLMNNANIDLKSVKNIKLYEWTEITVTEHVPNYIKLSKSACKGEYPNGTACKEWDEFIIDSYSPRFSNKFDWVELGGGVFNKLYTSEIKKGFGSQLLPTFNSPIETAKASENGTRFYKITYDKPIIRSSSGFGSTIDVMLESDGFTYHPVDLVECAWRLPIRIQENNGSAITSKVFNVSIDMSGANWNSNEYVMVDNNSVEIDFNISNPNTANAMLYFGMSNFSASADTTFNLYHLGGSCVGTENDMKGFDTKYDTISAYYVFNDDSGVEEIGGNSARLKGSSSWDGLGKYNTNGAYLPGSGANVICFDDVNWSGSDIKTDGSAFSIEFWMKTTSLWDSSVGRRDFMGIGAGGANDLLWDYDRIDGTISVYWGGNAVTISSGATTFVADQWYHMLYTQDGSDVGRMYRDGIKIAQGTHSGTISNADFLFAGAKVDNCGGGSDASNSGSYYIDEVIYHNTDIKPEDSMWQPSRPTVTVGPDISANAAPEVPFLDTPQNDTVILGGDVSLVFFNSSDADGDQLTYAIYLFNDSAETQIAYENASFNITAGNSTNYTIASEFFNGTMYWKVNVTDGSQPRESETRFFHYIPLVSSVQINFDNDIEPTCSITNGVLSDQYVWTGETNQTRPNNLSCTLDGYRDLDTVIYAHTYEYNFSMNPTGMTIFFRNSDETLYAPFGRWENSTYAENLTNMSTNISLASNQFNTDIIRLYFSYYNPLPHFNFTQFYEFEPYWSDDTSVNLTMITSNLIHEAHIKVISEMGANVEDVLVQLWLIDENGGEYKLSGQRYTQSDGTTFFNIPENSNIHLAFIKDGYEFKRIYRLYGVLSSYPSRDDPDIVKIDLVENYMQRHAFIASPAWYNHNLSNLTLFVYALNRDDDSVTFNTGFGNQDFTCELNIYDECNMLLYPGTHYNGTSTDNFTMTFYIDGVHYTSRVVGYWQPDAARFTTPTGLNSPILIQLSWVLLIFVSGLLGLLIKSHDEALGVGGLGKVFFLVGCLILPLLFPGTFLWLIVCVSFYGVGIVIRRFISE